MNSKPIGVLLAAGQSQRFGSNKLLQPITDNTPMLLLCAEKLSQVLPGSIVVINRELIGLQGQLEQLGLHVVVNEQSQQGMGSSIACAVRASETLKPDAAGWLILLADMPYIETHTLEQLVSRLEQGAGLVAPTYRQQRGHPVGFSQMYKHDLRVLNGDTGARDILKKNHTELYLLPVDDEGILIDIDRPDDIRVTVD
jgi:molybdenum cofactor cytidylyltransferase